MLKSMSLDTDIDDIDIDIDIDIDMYVFDSNILVYFLGKGGRSGSCVVEGYELIL